jgi:hypothetical protein
MRIPVTSQFWMMSTPRASAARAYPHATASWRTVPPRGCSSPPRIGKRAEGEVSSAGIHAAISSRLRNSASMPFSRIALPRRSAASMSTGECTRFSTPRALYMTLKLSSCDRLSHSFSENS